MQYQDMKKLAGNFGRMVRQTGTIAVAGVALCLFSPPSLAESAPPPSAAPGVKVALNAPTAAPGRAKARKPAAAAALSAPQAPVCAGDMPPPTEVNVARGKSVMLRLPAPIVRRTLGDPAIAGATLVSPQALYVVGTAVGSTDMILEDKTGKCAVVDVVVSLDTGALQAKLHELMPGEQGIKVASAADSLVLTGVVSDAMKADQAVMLASAYVARRTGAGGMQAPGMQAPGMQAPGGSGSPQQAQYRIVNMLSIAAPQQVMLEVKVAEVSKTLEDKLGAKFAIDGKAGNWTYSILSNFLSGGAGVLGLAKGATKSINLDAELNSGLVKILAEPNLISISGQEASFLAGGKIFIPVPQVSASGTTITLEEKEFGVGLKFTPTVLDAGRINLQVAPEVSELSATGTTVTASGTSGSFSILPTITTRRASTTVQLRDGQSFAIAGLIKNNVTHNMDRFPGLGEIPVLGALFRSTDFQNDKSELMIVVTPRLVKPLPPDYALPTDSYVPPAPADAMVMGKQEGAAPAEKPAANPTSPEAPKAGSGFEVK